MTEAELIQTAQEVWGNYISTMSIFVSIVSAYLIVAYIAGKKMTRSQVIIINILFGLFASYGINAMFGFSSIATEMATLAIEASPQRTVKGNEYAPIFTLCALIPIVLACFKFMWDIRHRMCQLRSKHWIDHLADPRNCKGPPSPILRH